MTGGTPEVRSDKSLTLLTFGPMDQWTCVQFDLKAKSAESQKG